MIVIATIGPASMSEKVIKEIINNGAHILRLNFSHNTIKNFEFVLNYVDQFKSDVKIMQDLSGNKIRVSNKLKKVFKVFSYDNVIFCSEVDYKKIKNQNNVIPLNIDFNDLLNVKCNNITMKDNTMIFQKIRADNGFIYCKVIRGGVIRAGKGCNIKGINRKTSCLSKNDKNNLDFAYKYLIDIISQSYVESPRQIIDIKNYLKKYNTYNPLIFAKIETKKGIDNIYNIASVCDGIIIGRGDLIPETSVFDVPLYEDYALKIAKKLNKKIILATHVLDSIQRNYALTLPETESIYYAIRHGIDGLLLAGETSVGKEPVKAVKTLKSLIKRYQRAYEG